MIYCYDLDGTITKCAGFGVSDKKIPHWIIKFVLFFYKPRLNKEIICFMYLAKENNNKNIIITRRDRRLKKTTISFLEKRKVPFDRIIFIGNKNDSIKRKLKAVIKINPKIYFDNNAKIVEEALKNGISAILI